MQVLSRSEWLPLAEAHRKRAQVHTRPHLARRADGEKHPVADFLFEYYNLSPGQLERWHPGLGVGLADAPEYAARGAYVEVDGVASVDEARLGKRLPGLKWTHDLLSRTASRPARTGCFGLHEWAMVYRDADDRRHPAPLRLGAAGTDEVVESHKLTCTHVDAFRFFTDEARPLNIEELGREHQLEWEQPGCLHATMDLYRIAFRLLPFAEATIVLDTFELALAVREVDMMASPYDLSDLGYEPIAIETPEGKAEYVRRQRGFTEAAAPLRARLLELVEGLLTTVDA
ncbi:3-methyladenine DNA glycosylase [Aeromicrobium duanguangcaii]|uniref:3-methyladenine DNA glycosylase n=1 Tax=Aeromicrobium duanguangcaii TaxID=2968086 RepID=A0ABY5KJM5_9ACTN|nr:3-methyladenine DNA glycosylase [Aeromicrobium duanguangcaii]MCD9152931.1 3-methyladenine DNA glycosylase [Aeromicrobium duanguangcaii]UUI69963.1 3-methyladenine DNA glycosylase [Aeromicrobium duanguangcaii]